MKQPRASSQGTVQIALRLPEELRDRVRDAADKEGSSLNSLIVRVLDDAIPRVRELDRAIADFSLACDQLPRAENIADEKRWLDLRDNALDRMHRYLHQSEEL